MKKKINLYHGMQVGQLINHDGCVWKIMSKGGSLSCFPGGTGVSEYEVEFIKKGYLLARERMREDATAITVLDDMQRVCNNGQGIKVVEWALKYIRENNYESARRVCMNDSDKLREFPEVMFQLSMIIPDYNPLINY